MSSAGTGVLVKECRKLNGNSWLEQDQLVGLRRARVEWKNVRSWLFCLRLIFGIDDEVDVVLCIIFLLLFQIFSLFREAQCATWVGVDGSYIAFFFDFFALLFAVFYVVHFHLTLRRAVPVGFILMRRVNVVFVRVHHLCYSI